MTSRSGLDSAAVAGGELAASESVTVAVRVDEPALCARVDGFDWDAAVALAAEGTRLLPGDLLAAPSSGEVEGISPGSAVELEVEAIGVLTQKVVG